MPVQLGRRDIEVPVLTCAIERSMCELDTSEEYEVGEIVDVTPERDVQSSMIERNVASAVAWVVWRRARRDLV